MNKNIELAILLLECGKQLINFTVDRDIALEAGGAGQFLDEAPQLRASSARSGSKWPVCAGLAEFLGDSPGNGTLIGEPEDHGRFTCQINHASPIPPWHALSAGSCPADRSLEYQREFRDPESAAQVTRLTLPTGRPRKREPSRSNFSTESVA